MVYYVFYALVREMFIAHIPYFYPPNEKGELRKMDEEFFFAPNQKNMNRIPFNGVFTVNIRNVMRKKRILLGLTYHRLGDLFGTDWSTVRKWEQGPTKKCELIYRPKIEGYINGDYDLELTGKPLAGKKYHLYRLSSSSSMYQCIERIAIAYQLCQSTPNLSDTFLKEIEGASNKAISKLLENGFQELMNNLNPPSDAPLPIQETSSNDFVEKLKDNSFLQQFENEMQQNDSIQKMDDDNKNNSQDPPIKPPSENAEKKGKRSGKG